MRAQVTLISAESKKLIAKAVARMDMVKQALEEGMVVIHPSSSTIFIVEEIIGQRPPNDVWVCGVVIPKGTCNEFGARVALDNQPGLLDLAKVFTFSWVLKKGKLESGIPLGTLLSQMGEKDVYIKGVNALDIEGRVGILFGHRHLGGGTMGVVMSAYKQKRFNLIFPVGLEKLVPIPIKEAAKEALQKKMDYSMGVPCGLLPCTGTVVTELNAIQILTGATATPIAAGGLGGAEGAITMVIKGEEQPVKKAIEYIEQVKGASLPQVREYNCAVCDRPGCSSAHNLKHWT